MKNNKINTKTRTNSSSFYLTIMAVMFAFTFLPSCDSYDDTPPESFYVEPEPLEQQIVVPSLNTGIDFETEIPLFDVFGLKDGDVAVTVIDNPFSGGINTSTKVVEILQTSEIEPWAGLAFTLSDKVDFSIDQAITVKVYSLVADQTINFKLEDANDDTISKETSAVTTVANGWEVLTFSFSESDSGKFDKVAMFFNFLGDKDVATTHYFDDMFLGEAIVIVGGLPSEAAPNPIHSETDVVSIFSDGYTNVAGTDFNPDWGQGTVTTQLEIAGNNTLKYESLNYQGTAFENPVDVSGMTMLHIDYWTQDSSALNGFLISSAPAEAAHAFAITTGQWVSEDIPLSEFSSVVDLADVIQMKFEGNGSIYLDNIYFHNGTLAALVPTESAPDPIHLETEVISIFSDAYTDVAGTDFNPDWGQGTVTTQVDIAGNNTLKYENLNYQGTAFASPIDASAMTMLHIDFWTDDSTAFDGFLISSAPAETAHTFAITTLEWVSVDIPLSEFSSVVDLADVIQMKFDGNGTIYFDNIYFHNGTLAAAAPAEAAPTPAHAETGVISIFSDAYTDVAGTDFNPNWGQGTVTTQVDIAGNNTLKYENLNYQGTAFASPIDASAMTMLHIDFWTDDSTAFDGFLISSGPVETAHAFDITLGQWVSVDIPLSEYSSVVNLADVIQMKFDGNGTIYFDNIYFHDGTFPLTAPAEAAPTPTQAEADVISIFSDAYTDVAGTDFNPNWGQGTVTTQVDIAGNNTLKYENLNYQGTAFANPIDASGKTMLHIDYWTADSTGFDGFLISSGPVETAHAFDITLGQWVSVDIPLSEYSSVVDLADVIQMKIDGNGTIFLDNIYFY
jgi:hypothetical protein